MAGCGIDATITLDQWSDVFTDLYGRIAHRFARTEVRERLRRYVLGLLGRVERKNGWQLAEAIGDADPQGVQRLVRVARWDADGVRDDLRDYLLAHLGDDASGVLIVDETGFLKKGDKSCGVARQYTGTAGDTVNAQVGVFLAYASDKGAGLIDRALYLPREWTGNRGRRVDAGIPTGIRFATKIALAQRMLTRAFATAAPARWVVADSGYGRSHGFRQWLEKRRRAYAVMIPKTNAIHYCGGRERAEQLGERLADDAWMSISAGWGAQGECVHDWACLPLSERCAKGMRRWLLVRRDLDDPEAHAYWLAYGPAETTIGELVRVCDTRWQIERVPSGQISPKRRGRSAWITTRCAPGRRGIGSSRSACWRTHFWLFCGRRRWSMRAAGVKRGGRIQDDPAHRAGNAPLGARAGRTRCATWVQVGLVALATGAPGGRCPLPRRTPCPNAEPTNDRPGDPPGCPGTRGADRCRVGTGPPGAATATTANGTTTP
jgi:SRSO17 transposase